jgi:hypothetical protein
VRRRARLSSGPTEASAGEIKASAGRIEVSAGRSGASPGQTEASAGKIEVSAGEIAVTAGKMEAVRVVNGSGRQKRLARGIKTEYAPGRSSTNLGRAKPANFSYQAEPSGFSYSASSGLSDHGRQSALSNFTPAKEETYMPKVKLNFKRLSVSEKIARARLIVQQMTANAANFPHPVPALADLSAVIDAAETAYNNALKTRAAAKEATATLEDKEDELDEMVSRMASYVDTASAGDEQIILSAGMDVRAPNVPTNQPPSVPTGLTPTMGDLEGEIDLTWNSVPGASSYIVQISPNPPTNTSWTQTAIVTVSKATVDGLTSGAKFWFRVAAVGGGGQSGWSDPAVKMAP